MPIRNSIKMRGLFGRRAGKKIGKFMDFLLQKGIIRLFVKEFIKRSGFGLLGKVSGLRTNLKKL
jgi:hypothetical protein